ncbi:hypothetical protein LJB71_08435 [Thermomonas sp. S9]|uniref:hypothetical protein n=1 Tax=Thermomonas sp. S9 TaxID=2885203 RepID=UPI00216B4647|nr:hypothetical protein [Thermomonas sp. S9]MCR6496242.1 hypothetical protein [Thermomonas sp. S9]
MQKKPSNLGLHSGLPKYTSEEAVREQLAQAPKLLGQSLATGLVRRTKATPAEKKSEPNPRD